MVCGMTSVCDPSEPCRLETIEENTASSTSQSRLLGPSCALHGL